MHPIRKDLASGQWAHPQREEIACHCHPVIESARANSHYMRRHIWWASGDICCRQGSGFVIDANLSKSSQVANVCRSAYYYLALWIARMRNSITTSVCKCQVHAFVTSRIDYGNTMLFGIPGRLIHRLEMVQRLAARRVLQIRRGDRQSMSKILRQLHWLPVKKCI